MPEINYNEIIDVITKNVKEVIEQKLKNIPDKNYCIPVEISVRHIHLTREVLDILYGKDYQLKKIRDLSQPGEFASAETVTIVGPKMRAIENVRILGPLRNFTQVELSRTDGIYLGIDLPLRVSGDIKGSAPITVIGPKGSIYLNEGAIRAARHIHMTPDDAKKFNVKDKQIVKVEIPGDCGVILDNVIVRVSDKFKLALHLDTDEGNCANAQPTTMAKIIL